MYKKLALLIIFVVFSYHSFAQEKPDYNGVWVVKLNSSIIYQGMACPPITRNVTQTNDALSNLSDELIPNAIISPSTISYTLNWSEKKEDIKIPNGKLTLFTKSGFNNENNFEIVETEIRKIKSKESKSTKKETWVLENEGKNLKIKTSSSDENGEHYSEILYEKDGFKWTSNPLKQLNSISGGVANAKPIKLEKPYHLIDAEIPKSNLVSVLVLVDEKGDVIMAKMIEGHSALIFHAEVAAKLSKFAPTVKQGVAVKETGIVNYFFTKK